MSRLIYNNIELSIIRTTSWKRDAVYSDDGTEYLYTRHLIEVTAIYNPFATAYTPATFVTSQGVTQTTPPAKATPILGNYVGGGQMAIYQSPANTDANIRHFLLQPRCTLKFTNPQLIAGGFSDFLLLSPDPATGYTTDAHFGPRPLYCHVTQIAGSRTFFVVYGIEVCVCECPYTNSPPAILSQRWSETHDIDTQYFTTRTISGHVKFRTDVLSNLQVVPSDFLGQTSAWKGLADDFRSQLFHPIPKNFKRESIRVVASSDGTELVYEIVDKEVYLSIGANDPAVEYKCFLTSSTGHNSGGAVLYASAKITAIGSPKTEKKDLWSRCVQIADAKLKFGPTRFITQASVTEDAFAPVVDYSVTVMLASSTQNVMGAINLPPAGIEFMSRDVGKIFSSAITTNPAPTGDGISRGAWIASAAAASYGSACGDEAEILIESGGSGSVAGFSTIASEGNTTQVTLKSEPTIIVGVTSLDAVKAAKNNYSNATQVGIWTEYTIDTAYRRREGVYAAPVASNDPNAPTEYVTLHAPTTSRTIAWTAMRIGDWPTYPDPNSVGSNDIFLHSEIRGSAVELLQDGQSFLFRVSGIYYYGCVSPTAIGSDLDIGLLPTVTGAPCSLPGDHMSAPILTPCGLASISTGGSPFGGTLPAPTGPGPFQGGLAPGSPGGGNTSQPGGSGGGSGGGGVSGGFQ